MLTAGDDYPIHQVSEPIRHAGTSEGVFEQPQVGVRCAQQHGHLVEGHAGVGFRQHAAHDLDGFASFTGRREDPHGIVERATRRRVGREEPPLQPRPSRIRTVACWRRRPLIVAGNHAAGRFA